MPSQSTTQTIERRLTPEQTRRRDRARHEARAIAIDSGYDGVTMQAVAERAGMTRVTLYRYFASKDHLLAEVAFDWGRELAAAIAAERIDARTGGDRLAAAFEYIIAAAAEAPLLTSAMLSAMFSNDPAARRTKEELGSVIGDYLGAALGDEVSRLPKDAPEVIAHVFFSVLFHLSAGDIDRDRAVGIIAAASRFCLSGESQAP